MIRNVTFVVVARNEAYAVKKCLASLAKLNYEDCEVLCIDSDSGDSTLEIMVKYANEHSEIAVFQCKGRINAAVARNIGQRRASKKYVHFIDGDVELNGQFVEDALIQLEGNKASIVTGRLKEIYYSPGYREKLQYVEDRFKISQSKEIYLSGGCFIVRAALLKEVGYWDENMAKGQDVDYTLRLSRRGKFVAIPVSMGIHHTQYYQERTLMFLKKRYPMHYGMLLRRNIDRPRVIFQLVKMYRGYFVGLSLFFLMFVGGLMSVANIVYWISVMKVVGAVVIIDFLRCLIRKGNVANSLVAHYCYTPFIILGLFVDKKFKSTSTQVVQVK